jgi:thiosulfate/3-mercaptopyruvate sulfurtransferase
MGNWLITVNELAACYQQPDVAVIDCRFALADPDAGPRQYSTDHIPGSFYLHLDRDLSGAKGPHGGRHPLPTPDDFAATMSTLGIDSNPPTLVIAYDDSRFAFASRLWWLLRYFGHDRVRVLDGGYKAWLAANLPVSAEIPAHRPGNFVAKPRAQMVVDIEHVKQIRNDADTALVDSREEKRFLGLEEPIDPVAGHIDGARNRPWQQASAEDGTALAATAQKQRLGDVADAPNIVVYCGSGVTACVNLLALAQIGREDAQLYAGSWSDWCSYPELVS